MMEENQADIEELVVREKMQVALEYQNEAWADGIADGIEPEILANAAIAMAIRETERLHGEECAEALVEALRSRFLAGEFSPNRMLQ